MAKERNNIYAVAADAVDLALDTAGAMGSMVGSMANAVGLGSDDHEAAEAAKPRSSKAHAGKTHAAKARSTKNAKNGKKATKSRKAA